MNCGNLFLIVTSGVFVKLLVQYEDSFGKLAKILKCLQVREGRFMGEEDCSAVSGAKHSSLFNILKM